MCTYMYTTNVHIRVISLRARAARATNKGANVVANKGVHVQHLRIFSTHMMRYTPCEDGGIFG